MKKSIFSLLFLIGCATMSSAQEITFTEVSHYFDHTKGNRKEYKAVEPRDDYELVLERVRQQVYASQPVEKMDQGATSLMKMLTPEGTWPQIDYKCFFRTNWEPVTHLNYVRQLATAYTCPEGEVENHNDWVVYGVSKFVAGAADGLYGAMGYAMDDYGMKAQKGGSCSTTRWSAWVQASKGPKPIRPSIPR